MYLFFQGLFILPCRWKKSQKLGRQAEIEFCQKNFLKRTTLIDIEVKYIKIIFHNIIPYGTHCRINREALLFSLLIIREGLFWKGGSNI